VDRIVSARIAAQPWYLRYPRALPVTIFTLIMAATLVAVVVIEVLKSERLDAQARAVASAISAGLERRATSHVAYLRAAAILLAQPGSMNAAGFRDFATELERDPEYRGAEGIIWVPRVEARRLAAFEAAQQAQGQAGFMVHPRPPEGQGYAYPVTFVGGTWTGRAPLGFDPYSEATRRAAMDAAMRQRQPVASGGLTLNSLPPGSNLTGFVIYMPVFSGPGVSGEAGERLLGFVGAPFNAHVFLDSALELVQSQGLARGFGVRLYDQTIAPDRLLAKIEPQLGATSSFSAPTLVAGHSMMVVVAMPQRRTLSTLSLLALASGLAMAGLLVTIAMLLTQQAQEDRASLAWLREQTSIRAALSRELNHRVKNTLANVLSLMALTRRRATDLDDFVNSLDGRIRALSATHDLLTQSQWGPTPLRSVVAAELAPYAQGGDHTLELDGPEVDLAPGDALMLGLAIHELATNASKYGALSVSTGRLEVRWEMASPERARIVWREHDGPQVAAERQRGFGTELIEKIVAHELGDEVDLRFEPDGVSCVLMVPVRLPAAFQLRSQRPRG
jgi:two-component sensor histidine kinase/CHASE1-domain containing sensor protein